MVKIREETTFVWRVRPCAHDLPSGVNELNLILDSYQNLYNRYRPYGDLAGKTPAQYLANHSATRPQPSQMS